MINEIRVEYKCRTCKKEWWIEWGSAFISSEMFNESCPMCDTDNVEILDVIIKENG